MKEALAALGVEAGLVFLLFLLLALYPLLNLYPLQEGRVRAVLRKFIDGGLERVAFLLFEVHLLLLLIELFEAVGRFLALVRAEAGVYFGSEGALPRGLVDQVLLLLLALVLDPLAVLDQVVLWRFVAMLTRLLRYLDGVLAQLGLESGLLELLLLSYEPLLLERLLLVLKLFKLLLVEVRLREGLFMVELEVVIGFGLRLELLEPGFLGQGVLVEALMEVVILLVDKAEVVLLLAKIGPQVVGDDFLHFEAVLEAEGLGDLIDAIALVEVDDVGLVMAQLDGELEEQAPTLEFLSLLRNPKVIVHLYIR